MVGESQEVKTGFLGGTFDPVHLGHLFMAQDALEALGLDRVYFVPTAANPLKEQPPAAKASDRKTMVELAQSFGMDTVAEWVTDEATATLLTKAGISHLQGFHFGQPGRADEMLAKWGCGADAVIAKRIPA